MSLINQMLQDLEKRQPGGEALPPSSVRAVPRPRRVRFFRPLLLLLGAAAGVLAWQFWRAPAPREAAPAIAAAPAPDAQPQPAPLPEASPPSLVAAAPAQAAETEIPPSPPPTEKRPATQPALEESAEARLTVQPAEAPPAPKAAPAPQAVAGDADTLPGIAKQVRERTPQQRADNEYRKALSLVQQGRIAEAIDGLSLALQIHAGHAAARQTLIGLLVESGRFGEAERRLQEGLALDRAQPELAMALARLQVERRDTGAAIATLERSLSAAERADYHAFLAALLQREGRHAEAIDHYRRALRRAPSAVWQMGLGISLEAEKQYPEAREAFARARAANTLSPELQAFVEQRLKQMGQ